MTDAERLRDIAGIVAPDGGAIGADLHAIAERCEVLELAIATRDKSRDTALATIARLDAAREQAEAHAARLRLRLLRVRGIADDLRAAVQRPPLMAPLLDSCIKQLHEETDSALIATPAESAAELAALRRVGQAALVLSLLDGTESPSERSSACDALREALAELERYAKS